MAWSRIVVLAAVVVVVATAVLGGRALAGRLAYCPRPYTPDLAHLQAGVEALRYRIAEGEQVSFYRRPSAAGLPQRLWLLCGGQGCHAIDWQGIAAQVADPGAGFLLFEYPGSGACAGPADPAHILAAGEQALATLRARLALTPGEFDSRLGILGYSLGTGAALLIAAHHPVQRIVLAAPYTSLTEMADILYFWPCGWFIPGDFDNAARLAEIAAQQPRPRVELLHGTADDCIPAAMPARLAAAHPGWIERSEIPGRTHDDIVIDAVARLAVH